MPFGREPTKRISVFSRKKLTANEEMSSVAGSALRSGRKATRSVTSASTTATSKPPTIMTGTRLAEEREQRIAGDRDQLAMGEIDQPHDPEDQPDAERGQRVEAADADGVDEGLDQTLHHGPLPPRACATPK